MDELSKVPIKIYTFGEMWECIEKSSTSKELAFIKDGKMEDIEAIIKQFLSACDLILSQENANNLDVKCTLTSVSSMFSCMVDEFPNGAEIRTELVAKISGILKDRPTPLEITKIGNELFMNVKYDANFIHFLTFLVDASSVGKLIALSIVWKYIGKVFQLFSPCRLFTLNEFIRILKRFTCKSLRNLSMPTFYVGFRALLIYVDVGVFGDLEIFDELQYAEYFKHSKADFLNFRRRMHKIILWHEKYLKDSTERTVEVDICSLMLHDFIDYELLMKLEQKIMAVL